QEPETARPGDRRDLRPRRRRGPTLRTGAGRRRRDPGRARGPGVRRPPLHGDRPGRTSLVLRAAHSRHRAGGVGRYRDWVNLELLAAELAGEPPYRARQVWAWAARGASGYDEVAGLPSPLRAELAEGLQLAT